MWAVMSLGLILVLSSPGGLQVITVADERPAQFLFGSADLLVEDNPIR
jgi:hypothetical protein